MQRVCAKDVSRFKRQQTYKKTIPYGRDCLCNSSEKREKARQLSVILTFDHQPEQARSVFRQLLQQDLNNPEQLEQTVRLYSGMLQVMDEQAANDKLRLIKRPRRVKPLTRKK